MDGTSHTLGIAFAFGVDALSFLVSLVTLWMIHLPATKKVDEALGMVLAGVLPKLPARYTISIILIVMSSMGIAWALLGLVTSTLLAALLALAMGTADGYIEIMLITWVQKRTPSQMQGRMMSLAMFVTMGLTPISTPTAGALVNLNPTLFLLVTGLLAAALSLVAALNFLVRERNMAELATQQADDG